MKNFIPLILLPFFSITTMLTLPEEAMAIDKCIALPRTIKVSKRSPQCGKVPTVELRGKWKNSFSAAFRWDDGTASGQDRNPFDLTNSSASSSPYKAQGRIRTKKSDFLCYGGFLQKKYPQPIQLTIKRSTAPVVDRFCVNF